MKTIQKILACTDFSTGSRNAIRYAAALSKGMNASLTLLHVHFDPVNTGNPADENALGKKLSDSADSLAAEFGIGVNTVLRSGTPVDEIVAAVKAGAIDLVVTGAKETAAGSGLVGGLVYDLMHASLFPVLAVPADVHFEPPKTIALSFEPDHHQDYDDSILREILRFYSAPLVLVHVQEKNSPTDRKQKLAEAAVEYRYAELMHRIQQISSDSLAEGLENFFAEKQTDMLVILPHRHHFFERMMRTTQTQQILRRIHYPMLTLPRKL
jgi:nucleotide-binding universal stress UspA family protein